MTAVCQYRDCLHSIHNAREETGYRRPNPTPKNQHCSTPYSVHDNGDKFDLGNSVEQARFYIFRDFFTFREELRLDSFHLIYLAPRKLSNELLPALDQCLPFFRLRQIFWKMNEIERPKDASFLLAIV